MHTTSSWKCAAQEHLCSWLVHLCMIFSMHYALVTYIFDIHMLLTATLMDSNVSEIVKNASKWSIMYHFSIHFMVLLRLYWLSMSKLTFRLQTVSHIITNICNFVFNFITIMYKWAFLLVVKIVTGFYPFFTVNFIMFFSNGPLLPLMKNKPNLV